MLTMDVATTDRINPACGCKAQGAKVREATVAATRVFDIKLRKCK